MDKMFLIFNTRTGSVSHLNSLSAVKEVSGNNDPSKSAHLFQAMKSMHDGEYFREGSFVVSCSTGGITTEELLLRRIKR